MKYVIPKCYCRHRRPHEMGSKVLEFEVVLWFGHNLEPTENYFKSLQIHLDL
jgi:hypothetical protein